MATDDVSRQRSVRLNAAARHRETESYNFSTCIYRFPSSDKKNMGAQNFNFAHKFPRIGDLQPQIMNFGTKIF